MKSTDDRLEEIYTALCKVMRYPEDFGLGPHVPLPLAHVLEEILRTLSEIMQDKVVLNGDLEAELSQDADQSCLDTGEASRIAVF